MAVIRPCADLRNNYNEISKICHETKEPVYITKNGYNDLVVLSNEAYEEYDDARTKKMIYEIFYKEYPDFESFKKDLYEKIEIGLKQVKEGKGRPAEECFKELEEKYKLWKNTE